MHMVNKTKKTEKDDVEPIYTRVPAAEQKYGISRSEFYRGIYSGELKALRFKSRVWLLKDEDIEHWINANSEPNAA